MNRLVLFLLLLPLPVLVWGQDQPVKAAAVSPDSTWCFRAVESYRETLRGHDTVAGARQWAVVFDQCPGISELIYMEGALILDYLIAHATTDTRRVALIDSLMLLYDRRIAYYGQEGFVLGRKGVELYIRDKTRLREAFDIMERSILLEGYMSRPAILVNYLDAASRLAVQGVIDTATLTQLHARCRDFLVNAFKHNRIQKDVMKEAVNSLDTIFYIYLGCDALTRKYGPVLQGDSLNKDILSAIIKDFEKNKCQIADLYFKATKKLYDLDSTPENALQLGRYFMKKSALRLALPLMLKAIKCADPKDRAEAYLSTASIYRLSDRAPFARDYAIKAYELNPASGLPFIVIGDCYASSARECSLNELEEKTVYWSAIDMYEKAMTIEPALTSVCQQRILEYGALLPDEEELKSLKLTEGDSFTVGCWINHDTRVRAKKAL